MSGVARRRLWIAAQLALVAAVLWFAASRLSGQWTEFRAVAGTLRPSWSLLLLSSLVVLATYAMLVEAWRVLVRAAGGRLRFLEAVRIWTISNLGRYLPGKVWSVGAMGILAQRAGVSPVAAAGSAIVGTLINLVAGGAVLALCGAPMLRVLSPALERVAPVLAIAAVVALVATPLVIAPGARLAGRLLGRDVTPPSLGARALWIAVLANVLAWLLYGVAFRILARAFFPVPTSAGDWLGYVAVFTGSYLAGYLALLVPGGLVVREGALIAGLSGLGLASVPQATVLAVASRLWLTVLEIAPGLLFLARDAAVRSPRPSSDATS